MTETKTGSIFVLTAYRWGLRDAHSYVVGAYPTRQLALSAAEQHLNYRGGKYGVEVVECGGEADESGENGPSQVAYLESPYFGMAGQNHPAHQPADNEKRAEIIPQQLLRISAQEILKTTGE